MEPLQTLLLSLDFKTSVGALQLMSAGLHLPWQWYLRQLTLLKHVAFHLHSFLCMFSTCIQDQ